MPVKPPPRMTRSAAVSAASGGTSIDVESIKCSLVSGPYDPRPMAIAGMVAGLRRCCPRSLRFPVARNEVSLAALHLASLHLLPPDVGCNGHPSPASPPA